MTIFYVSDDIECCTRVCLEINIEDGEAFFPECMTMCTIFIAENPAADLCPYMCGLLPFWMTNACLRPCRVAWIMGGCG